MLHIFKKLPVFSASKLTLSTWVKRMMISLPAVNLPSSEVTVNVTGLSLVTVNLKFSSTAAIVGLLLLQVTF